MKTTTITACALLGLVALTACEKKPGAAADSPSASESGAAAYVPPSTPEPHLVSTQGTYFLTKKVSTETDSGVINFQAGTKLVRVNDRYVTADGKRLALRPDQITNNLQAAYVAAGRDAKLLAVILNATQSARAVQGTTPPAATSTATATMNTSGPVNPGTYARPGVIKDGEAENRKSDPSRKHRN